MVDQSMEDISASTSKSSQIPIYRSTVEDISPEPTKKRPKNTCSPQPLKPELGISPVDPIWQDVDPTPDVLGLFTSFDRDFFESRLTAVEVRWSPRMTLCAGICVYEGRGGLCSVRLSEPLLKYRPRSDLVETLLHEMIHAYLFVTENNRDRDGHGPNFKFHMERINKSAKTNITVYHSFHDEVDNYKVHWWRCNGPCAERAPFFGFVRRSMNRAPSSNDLWWRDHQALCSGTFIKVKEPDGYEKKARKTKESTPSKPNPSTSTPDIRQFLQKDSPAGDPINAQPRPATLANQSITRPFLGQGRVLGGSVGPQQSRLLALTAGPSVKTPASRGAEKVETGTDEMTECPVCATKQPILSINAHLDECLLKI